MEVLSTLELPRIRSLAVQTLPKLFEAILVPLALFYASFWLAGVWAAFIAALAWCYGTIGWRAATRRRVPGILVLGALLLTGRTAIAALSGSAFMYFLQPTLGTLLLAAAFLGSVRLGHPLAERLALDFCPMPAPLLERPHTRVVFTRISLLWCAANLANASLSLWLLVSQPVATYVIARQGMSLAVTGVAIALSTWLFMSSMRKEGVRVRFGSAVVS